MNSFFALLVLIGGLVLYFVIEYRKHRKAIFSIPLRVHVNGSRGKSSVTRLIGAGLREGGIKCITKVTGTYPRLILQDGSETIIHRKASANILEQLAIIRYASQEKTQALVIECMALQPQYQTITEHKMVHSNVSVMTNVRLDHIDIMGKNLSEIATTMGRTIPYNQHLISAEKGASDVLQKIAGKRNTTTCFVNGDMVSREEMKGFSYIEHNENVAIAIAVCEFAGIDRKTALAGMYKAIPDAGVLRMHHIMESGKEICLFNAFAANDPESSLMIWHKIGKEIGFNETRIVMINTRQDRLDRAKQLAEASVKQIGNEADYIMLIGQSCGLVEKMVLSFDYPPEKLITLGWTSPQEVYEAVLKITPVSSTIVAIGNMGGMGASTIEYFVTKSIKQ